MFGLGGALYLFQSFPSVAGTASPGPGREADAPASRGSQVSPVYGTLPGADRYTASTAGLVFPARRRSAILPLAGSLIFVVLGVLMLLIVGTGGAEAGRGGQGGPVSLSMAGFLAIIVFGGFAVMAAGSLVRPGGVALLPEGVYLRSPGGRCWVRWDDLAYIFLRSQSASGSSVALLAASPEAVALTGFNRWTHRMSRSNFGMDMSYPTQYLSGDGSEIVAYIDYYRRVPEARPWLAYPGYFEG